MTRRMAQRALWLAQMVFAAAIAGNECWSQPMSQRVSATWTSANNANVALTLQVAGFTTIGITYSNNGLSIASGNLNFEVDNGQNVWWPLVCQRLSSVGSESAYNMAGAIQAWQCPVAGMVQARVRLSPVIMGNNAIISIQGSQGAPLASNLNANATFANNNVTVSGNVSITSGNSNVSALPTYGNAASNQQAVTTANTALQSVAGVAGVCVTTLSTSNASAFLGVSGVTTSTGMELPPGASYCSNVNNPAVIFVIAAANNTTTVTWFATKP